MSLRRVAIIFDSGDDSTDQLIDILSENGYIIHVYTHDEERAQHLTSKPVYIHLYDPQKLISGSGEELSSLFEDLSLEETDLSIVLLDNDEINLKISRYLRSRGVPTVIMKSRKRSVAEEAENEDIKTIDISSCVLGRIQRILRLKFVRITIIRGSLALLECVVTGDMKILGKTIEELEKEHNISIAIHRSGDVRISPEEIIQEGDYLLAIGHINNLRSLVE